MQTDKQKLIDGLNEQFKIMISNARLMTEIYKDSGNAKELYGAAKITADWINAIQKGIES